MSPPSPGGPEKSIDALLRESVHRHRDRPAIAFAGRRLRYGELDEAVDALAERIESAAGEHHGALHGRPIVVIAPNTPALVTALFAIWRLGAVAVPLNARLREHELRQILVDAEPVAVLSVGSYLGYAFTELMPRLLPELPSVRACLFLDADGAVESEEQRGGVTSRPEPLTAEVGVILYTSGTSGRPKGALVGHLRELEAGPVLAAVLQLQPADAVAFVIPLSHAFGLTCLLACLSAGATAVLVDSTSSLRPLLDAVAAEEATVLHGSPRLFSALLEASPTGLPSVRTGFVGGAPSPASLLERLDDAGTRILNVYGLTETGAVSCCRPDDSADVRYTTAGRALPAQELRIVSADDGLPGELQARGPHVTPGYLRNPEETATAFDADWFRTGDLATIENGYVRIAGRSSEVVNVGGFNVFPAEVEAVLLGHPHILAAAVVGVGDAETGETLQAFVVPRPGTEFAPAALLRFARGQIAGYKLPYAIHVLPELPLLPSGKPDRQALRRSVSIPVRAA
ncbi:MAG: acyl--CoA ligase [Actinobacteria bacterium]|nr:acyl--CoA ligase [Actinomycetota bacterium]